MSVLRNVGPEFDARWRSLFAAAMGVDGPSLSVLLHVWDTILEFDSVLRDYVADPVAVSGPAVVVAGSGKESFKTFNVSTVCDYQRAAALLVDACTDTSHTFHLSACNEVPLTSAPRAAGLVALAHRAAAVLAVLPLTIAGWTVGRRSPQVRRLASYSRLYATPPPIRHHIDHHLSPPGRVGALARELGTPLTWVRP